MILEHGKNLTGNFNEDLRGLLFLNTNIKCFYKNIYNLDIKLYSFNRRVVFIQIIDMPLRDGKNTDFIAIYL